MSWALQGVVNACIQILVIISLGYLLAYKGLLGRSFLPQVNAYILLVAFPCFNIVELGITIDLQQAEAWRALAAYIMWITIIQVSVLVWCWKFAPGGIAEAGLLNLLLAANNTVIIGFPVMQATFGTAGHYMSLLTCVALFLQVMPFSICIFEAEKWAKGNAANLEQNDQGRPGTDKDEPTGSAPSVSSQQAQHDLKGVTENGQQVEGQEQGQGAAAVGLQHHPGAELEATGGGSCDALTNPVGTPRDAQALSAAAAAAAGAAAAVAAIPGGDASAALAPGVSHAAHASGLQVDSHETQGSYPTATAQGSGHLHRQYIHASAGTLSSTVGGTPGPSNASLSTVSAEATSATDQTLSQRVEVEGRTSAASASEVAVTVQNGMHGGSSTASMGRPMGVDLVADVCSVAITVGDETAAAPAGDKPYLQAWTGVTPSSLLATEAAADPQSLGPPTLSPQSPTASASDAAGHATAVEAGAAGSQHNGTEYQAAAVHLQHNGGASHPSGIHSGLQPQPHPRAGIMTSLWRRLVHRRQRDQYGRQRNYADHAPGGNLHGPPSLGPIERTPEGRGGHSFSPPPPGQHNSPLQHQPPASPASPQLHPLHPSTSPEPLHLPASPKPVTPRVPSYDPRLGAASPQHSPLQSAAPASPRVLSYAPSFGAAGFGRQWSARVRSMRLTRWAAVDLPVALAVLQRPETQAQHPSLPISTSQLSLQEYEVHQHPGQQAQGHWRRRKVRYSSTSPSGTSAVPLTPTSRRRQLARALSGLTRQHGSLRAVAWRFFSQHARAWGVVLAIFKNPMLWSLLLAIIISTSGLRRFLDPSDSHYVLEMGWLFSALQLVSGTAVPLALFSNGVFMHGKDFWSGNIRKGLVIVVLKIIVLPALQFVCARICQLSTAFTMSLLLLSVCPVASTAFVVASSYNHGPEIVTFVTLTETVLLIPLVIAAIRLPLAFGIIEFDPADFPLP